jgi:hypothetical protein
MDCSSSRGRRRRHSGGGKIINALNFLDVIMNFKRDWHCSRAILRGVDIYDINFFSYAPQAILKIEVPQHGILHPATR